MIKDVSIDVLNKGIWAKPWNREAIDKTGDENDFYKWYSEGQGEVGCIYTGQGIEFDYDGVIIGKDLVWRNDKWVAQPSYNYDPAFKKFKQENRPSEEYIFYFKNT